LELVELSEKADLLVKTYSCGMMRRLEIAIIDFGKIVALNSPKHLKSELGGDIITLELLDKNISFIT